MIRERIYRALHALGPNRRPPDFVVGEPSAPYLERWWLIPRNPICNVYLHRFLRSDDDRALHDHPWASVSWLLRGSYVEWLLDGPHERREGAVLLRRPSAAHRIEISKTVVWTLFVTGPHVRQWGFLCPQGWRHWTEFVSADAPGRVGRGCE